MKQQQTEILEKISQMTADQAKEYLLQKVETEVRREAALKIAEIEQELKKPGSGYTSIRENAVKLALAGITTLEEILRVINEED